MFDACRPMGRLFYLPLILTMLVASTQAQGPATTTVSEVRWSDSGWGPGNSRNLVGRFGSETFTLPRLSRVQTVFLRQYDASTPPKYSRYSTALHVDYPL
jgi:hypothetical protein